MAHHLFNRLKLLLVIVLLLSISLACLTLTGSAPLSSEGGTPQAMEVEDVIGPGSFHFPNPRAGMAELSSYTATLTRSFDGTEAGQARQWSSTHVLIYNKEPAARVLTIETTAELAEGEPTSVSEMNGVAYIIGADGSCDTSIFDPVNSLIDQQDLAGSLTGVIGAEAAGHETVNGVETDHYTFDERALGEKEIKSNGELWVASQGGYMVLYLLTTTGDEDYYGEGMEGTQSWDYELTTVNQPVEILVPAECPQGMVDAPRLADATNITSVPGFLEYESASGVAEAAAFYQEQLPTFEWSPLGDPDLSDTTAVMGFTRGEQLLSLIITQNENKTIIRIILSENPGIEPLIIQ